MTSFSYQFTLDEYRKEIEDYKKGDLKMPSKTDFTDLLYTKKYAHTLIPLEAYRFRHPDSYRFSTKENMTGRLFFYGWNNLSQFEIDQIAAIKDYLETIKVVIPEHFHDRELLKFVQANFFDLKKTSVKLSNHFEWLSKISGI